MSHRITQIAPAFLSEGEKRVKETAQLKLIFNNGDKPSRHELPNLDPNAFISDNELLIDPTNAQELQEIKKAFDNDKITFDNNVTVEQQNAFKNLLKRGAAQRYIRNAVTTFGITLLIAAGLATFPFWSPIVGLIISGISLMIAGIAAATVIVGPLIALVTTGIHWLKNRKIFNLKDLLAIFTPNNPEVDSSSETSKQESSETSEPETDEEAEEKEEEIDEEKIEDDSHVLDQNSQPETPAGQPTYQQFVDNSANTTTSTSAVTSPLSTIIPNTPPPSSASLEEPPSVFNVKTTEQQEENKKNTSLPNTEQQASQLVNEIANTEKSPLPVVTTTNSSHYSSITASIRTGITFTKVTHDNLPHANLLSKATLLTEKTVMQTQQNWDKEEEKEQLKKMKHELDIEESNLIQSKLEERLQKSSLATSKIPVVIPDQRHTHSEENEEEEIKLTKSSIYARLNKSSLEADAGEADAGPLLIASTITAPQINKIEIPPLEQQNVPPLTKNVGNTVKLFHIHVLTEILHTEKVYCDGLKKLVTLLNPLINNEKLTSEEKNQFLKLITYLELLSDNPYKDFSEIQITVENFDKIIADMQDIMSKVDLRVVHEAQLAKTYNKNREFILKHIVKKDLSQVMDLLITPVQRPPRRTLLTKDLLKQYHKYSGENQATKEHIKKMMIICESESLTINAVAKIHQDVFEKSVEMALSRSMIERNPLTDSCLEEMVKITVNTHIAARANAFAAPEVRENSTVPNYILTFHQLIDTQISACAQCKNFNDIIDETQNTISGKLSTFFKFSGKSKKTITEIMTAQKTVADSTLFSFPAYNIPSKVKSINTTTFDTHLEQVIAELKHHENKLQQAIKTLHEHNFEADTQKILNSLTSLQSDEEVGEVILEGLKFSTRMLEKMLQLAEEMQVQYETHPDSEKTESQAIKNKLVKLVKFLITLQPQPSLEKKDIVSSSATQQSTLALRR